MKIFLSTDSVEGGGVATSSPSSTPAAPVQFQEGTMPDSMKGTTISFGDEGGDTNIVDPTIDEGATIPDVKEPVVTTTKVAKTDTSEPANVKLKPGELPKLPEVPKKVAATVPVVEPTAKTTTPTVVPKGQRDYTQFDEELRPLLKAMPNATYAAFEKRLSEGKVAREKLVATETELTQLKSNPNAIPQDWVNHPDSYILHPDYQQGYQMLNKAQFEAEHYKNQLIAIENNEEYRTILGYNKQTGQAVFSEPQKPDAASKVNVGQYMQAAGQVANQWQNQLNNFQAGFKQNYRALESKVETIIADKWPWAKDANDPRNAQAKQFDEATPREFRNHPSHKVARLMWTTIFELAGALDDMKAQVATGKTLKEIQSEVEPTVSSVPSVTSGAGGKKVPGKVSMFNLEGMED